MAVCRIRRLALVFVFMICDVCCGGQVFSPHLGQNITLTCQVSNSATIAAVWWARRDLKSEYVFYYRDGQSDTDIQHPSFQCRVELAEGELKDGNLSVVLMNVSSSDYGEYTCGFWKFLHSSSSSPSYKMAVCQILRLALVFVFMISDVCCDAVSLSEGHELPDKMQQGPLTTKQHAGQVFSPHLGQNITLTCQVSNSANIAAVWWARRDLKSEYVFYYRDGQSDTDIQHPSFQCRVELAEGELKDGNLSVVLMNVSSSDYGEYTCGFKEHKEGTVVKNELICNITLKKPGAEKENYMGGNTESEHPVNGPFPHGHVGLGVAAVLFLAAVVSVTVQIYRRPVIKEAELSADDESKDVKLILNATDASPV